MYLIIGLGNPEEEYGRTRHNMGFNVINKLSNKYGIEVNKKKFDGLCGDGMIEGEKVILLKPQTYMNLSGKSIVQVVNFYKIPLENVIVIYDDIDIEPGLIRIRKKGSSGSHNGMKSVIAELGSGEFMRVRVGIGKPKYDGDMINYVIGAVPEEEQKELEKGVEKAKEAVIEILRSGIDTSMNKFN
ncbi:MAG: aminoacyl-tRNA hydrolase [Clostridia bacterium]|nr:aminoacyl-tRNA hydrolase [Clostridia bacterium]